MIHSEDLKMNYRNIGKIKECIMQIIQIEINHIARIRAEVEVIRG